MLNSECALNRKGLGIESGAIYSMRYPTIGGDKITMEEYAIESIIRGYHIYKSISHPILGEQFTLERERMTIVMTDTLSVWSYNSSLPSSTLIRQEPVAQPLPS